MFEDLKIILWPDPRLLKRSQPVTVFDEKLKALTGRMIQLMHEARGVGLAAPQVGENVRLFVISHTGKPEDDRIYVNPVLSEPAGDEEDEEGCLSLPGINAKIIRSESLRMSAQDLDGKPIEELATGYIARIWQHEFDHLSGTLLMDRMGEADKLGAKRILRDLRKRWDDEHPPKK